MLLKEEPQTYLKSANGKSMVLNIWFSIHEHAGKQVENGNRLQFGSYCMIYIIILSCRGVLSYRLVSMDELCDEVLKRASAILYLLSAISVK